MKKFLTIALLALAGIGLGVAIKNNLAPPAAAPETAEAAALPADGIVVTYFTTDVRCPSCLQIEDWSRKAVEAHFGDELTDGRIVYRVVNFDRPENKRLIERYELVSKTVIVSQRAGGKEQRWINLDDVWLKLDDEADFAAYVTGAIDKYLEQT